MARACGSCTLCCKLLPVVSLSKKANQRCTHQGSKGCTIYARRPLDCISWSCEWLTNPDVARLRISRPDYTGYVIDPLRDLANKVNNKTGETTQIEVIQVWVDPERPDAWKEQRLMDYIDYMARTHGYLTLIRHGSRWAFAIIAPCLSETGNWIIEEKRETNPSIGRFAAFPKDIQDMIYNND